jgi:hypothetical protein
MSNTRLNAYGRNPPGDMAGWDAPALVVDDHEMFSEALSLLFGREAGIELVELLPAGSMPWSGAGRRPRLGPHRRGRPGHRWDQGHPADPCNSPEMKVWVATSMQLRDGRGRPRLHFQDSTADDRVAVVR